MVVVLVAAAAAVAAAVVVVDVVVVVVVAVLVVIVDVVVVVVSTGMMMMITFIVVVVLLLFVVAVATFVVLVAVAVIIISEYAGTSRQYRGHCFSCGKFLPVLVFTGPLHRPTFHRLAGLLIKASASEAEDSGFESRLRRDFPGSSHTSDLKTGTPVATLPGA